MSQIYCGLERRIIQRNLSSIKQQQNVRPLFQNKVPLRPVRASKVQERHQEDLVRMASMPATIDGDTYKYIMCVGYRSIEAYYGSSLTPSFRRSTASSGRTIKYLRYDFKRRRCHYKLA